MLEYVEFDWSDDFAESLQHAVPELSHSNYFKWLLPMTDYLSYCDHLEYALPRAEGDDEPENPRAMEMTAVLLRRTFCSTLRCQVEDQACVNFRNGRSIWAYLEKTFIRRGVGAFLDCSIDSRYLHWDPERPLSEYLEQQRLVGEQIKKTGVALTPELESMINLYMVVPHGSQGFQALKRKWYSRWETTTFSSMQTDVERLLEYEKRLQRKAIEYKADEQRKVIERRSARKRSQSSGRRGRQNKRRQA